MEGIALFSSLLPIPLIVLYNVYLLLDLVLMSSMLVLFRPQLFRWALVADIVLVLIWCVECSYFGMASWFNIVFLLTSSLLVCALSSSVLWHLSIEERGPLHRSPLFWLILGMVIYFGGIAPVFSSFNFLAKRGDLMSGQVYWVVRVLCAVRYLTVAWACVHWRNPWVVLRNP